MKPTEWEREYNCVQRLIQWAFFRIFGLTIFHGRLDFAFLMLALPQAELLLGYSTSDAQEPCIKGFPFSWFLQRHEGPDK